MTRGGSVVYRFGRWYRWYHWIKRNGARIVIVTPEGREAPSGA